jgi:hypothetical protein
LERQYLRQSEFTDVVLKHLYGVASPADLTGDQLLDYATKMVLAIHREADELLDELPWKHHRLYEDVNIVRTNVLEEIIDIVKFGLAAARTFNFTAEEVVEAFDQKSNVVEDRWRQEHDHADLRSPVVLVDLDGVLSEYPKPFLDFVFDHTGERFRDMAHIDTESPSIKRAMKHLYRQSGIKRILPPILSSIQACQVLDRAGYSVVIMSQRPYHLYSRIYGDTMFWLNANNVPYKRLIFTADKGYRLVASQLKDKVAFAVDDDEHVVKVLRELGIRTYELVPLVKPDSSWLDREGGFIESMMQIPEVESGERAQAHPVRS